MVLETQNRLYIRLHDTRPWKTFTHFKVHLDIVNIFIVPTFFMLQFWGSLKCIGWKETRRQILPVNSLQNFKLFRGELLMYSRSGVDQEGIRTISVVWRTENVQVLRLREEVLIKLVVSTLLQSPLINKASHSYRLELQEFSILSSSTVVVWKESYF